MEKKKFRVETFVILRGGWKRDKVREIATHQGVLNFVKRQPIGAQVIVSQEGKIIFNEERNALQKALGIQW